MQDGKVGTDIFRGWLMKWTNYIKGYQKRWFVLSNGLLSYYRNQAEVAHTCRGTINLATAFICTEDDPSSFVVSNGSTHYFHLKASSEVERQKWVTALELVKAKAIKMLESDDEEDDDKNESCTKPLSSKVDDLQTCNDLVAKHGTALQKAISEVQDLSEFRDEEDELAKRLKVVNEKATLFRITSSAMISACGEFLDLAQRQEKNFQKVLDHERAHRIRLEQTVEDLAKQHNFLEEACRERVVPKHKTIEKTTQEPSMTAGSPSIKQPMDTGHDSSDDETEFFDAEDLVGGFALANAEFPTSSSESFASGKNVTSHKRSASDYAVSPGKNLQVRRVHSSSAGDLVSSSPVMKSPSGHFGFIKLPDDSAEKTVVKKSRRKTIPPKPTQSLSLWNILKNCIGKDLSKIPMPVNFNEPLSMLQRLTEEMEYSDLLDKAAASSNSLEEMCYVAAFTISAYSTTSVRTGKPFNPLLGETFEMDKSQEEGWRCLAEQVCHHPPISCFHIEHSDWTYWQDFTATSKFRGNYLQIVPLGCAHLTFRTSGNHYTWRKVTTTVRNIIVGKLWVDQSGEMDIVNHTTGDVCKLKYNAYTYFSRETPRKVTGYVLDKSKVTHYVLTGTWDAKIDCAEVVYTTKSEGGQPKHVAQTKVPVTLWKMNLIPDDREPQYNFSEFAMTLNEPDDLVAISDSRFRPDQRLMELGKWDDANTAKGRLEEKQRAKRREREAEAELAKREGRVYEDYKPVWFEKVYDEMSDLEIHVYKGGYWEAKEKQDWSMSPDIF